MAPHLNQQLREHTVTWQYEAKKAAVEISGLSDCSEITVFEVHHMHQTFSQVSNPYQKQQG